MEERARWASACLAELRVLDEAKRGGGEGAEEDAEKRAVFRCFGRLRIGASVACGSVLRCFGASVREERKSEREATESFALTATPNY